jgi:hypothetical protein
MRSLGVESAVGHGYPSGGGKFEALRALPSADVQSLDARYNAYAPIPLPFLGVRSGRTREGNTSLNFSSF